MTNWVAGWVGLWRTSGGMGLGSHHPFLSAGTIKEGLLEINVGTSGSCLFGFSLVIGIGVWFSICSTNKAWLLMLSSWISSLMTFRSSCKKSEDCFVSICGVLAARRIERANCADCHLWVGFVAIRFAEGYQWSPRDWKGSITIFFDIEWYFRPHCVPPIRF